MAIENENVMENVTETEDDVFGDIFVDDAESVDETAENQEIVNPENVIDIPEPAETETPAAETETPAKPKGKPGRPRLYDDNHRAAFASMIRSCGGMSQARAALMAHTGMTIDDVDGYDEFDRKANLERAHKAAKDRDQTMFPADQSFPVSMVTLISVANEHGIARKAGRPKK